MRKPLFVAIIASASALGSAGAPVAAQNSLPGLENFTLERSQPTPSPTPSPTPPPAAMPTPASTVAPVASPSPTPAPTATSRPVATPTPRETPSPRITATAPAAVPTPAPATTPMAEPTPIPTTDASSTEIGNTLAPAPSTGTESVEPATRWDLWAALVAVLFAGLGAFLWWQRRAAASDDEGGVMEAAPVQPPAPAITPAAPAEPQPAPAPPPPPAPVAPAPVVPGGLVTSSLKRGTSGGLVTSTLAPELRVALVPIRGGVDTLRATIEYELQVGNVGRGTARGVFVEAWLTSAGHDTAAELAELFARPAGEPMLAPFDLAPSAAINLAGLGVVPREMLATISAGDRRMFVPVLAARIGFVDGRGPQHLTAAFLVGIERDGQERLAPLPLDRGARMHERLVARPYDL